MCYFIKTNVAFITLFLSLPKILKVMDFISTVLENIPLGVLKNHKGEKLCCLVYILAYVHRHIYMYMYVK